MDTELAPVGTWVCRLHLSRWRHRQGRWRHRQGRWRVAVCTAVGLCLERPGPRAPCGSHSQVDGVPAVSRRGNAALARPLATGEGAQCRGLRPGAALLPACGPACSSRSVSAAPGPRPLGPLGASGRLSALLWRRSGGLPAATQGLWASGCLRGPAASGGPGPGHGVGTSAVLGVRRGPVRAHLVSGEGGPGCSGFGVRRAAWVPAGSSPVWGGSWTEVPASPQPHRHRRVAAVSRTRWRAPAGPL